MFLSRVQLNPMRRGARPLLSSPHALHAAVLTSFPDPSPTDTGRVLWRLDLSKHKAQLFVVSPARPDFTQIAEQAGWPSLPETMAVRAYSPLLQRLENGHRYAFRLTANPTRSSPKDKSNSGRGKVFGHVTVAQQEEWLLAQQERCGFTIGEHKPLPVVHPDDKPASPAKVLTVFDRQTISFSRRETRVTLRVATFDGILSITDVEAFRRALSFGIGRAKGYGCGLMTIAPAS